MSQVTINARLAYVTRGAWNPSEQEVYRIEKGLRLVSDIELVTLARVLETTVVWLLTGTANEEALKETWAGSEI